VPNWRELANLLIKKEREHALGLRRQKIYVWNKEMKEWDQKEESVWVKNKEGKEKLLHTQHEEKGETNAVK